MLRCCGGVAVAVVGVGAKKKKTKWWRWGNVWLVRPLAVAPRLIGLASIRTPNQVLQEWVENHKDSFLLGRPLNLEGFEEECFRTTFSPWKIKGDSTCMISPPVEGILYLHFALFELQFFLKFLLKFKYLLNVSPFFNAPIFSSYV